MKKVYEVFIIAEGPEDINVITLILKGLSVSQANEYKLIDYRPKLRTDRTDTDGNKNKNQPQQELQELGGWNRVKNRLTGTDPEFNPEDLTQFLMFDDRLIIIQTDSAECTDTGFGVQRPDSTLKQKNLPEYVGELRQRIIEVIQSWMKEGLNDEADPVLENTSFAVTVEETEAWILALKEKNPERSSKPKEKLEPVKNSKGYDINLLSKKKKLATARKNSLSLNLFLTDLEKR